MSLIEKGVYIELLADQWCNGPFSLEMAFRVCPEAERGVVEYVVRSKFVQGDDGNWFNNRLEQERISQEERRKVQAENGKKGGRPKANENPKETHRFNLALQNGKPNGSQVASQSEAKINPSVSVSVSVSDSVSDAVSVSPKAVDTDADAVVDAWNKSSASAKVKKLTGDRATRLRARLRDPDWPWREAIAKLPIPNTEKFDWQPDFDWLIANDRNAYSLAEGKYDRKCTSNGQGPGVNYDPNHDYESEAF
jgi:uncharacterized protein YdaU (DUF1376 family)